MTKEQFFDYFIESASKVYIEVMGLEKWNILTDTEKHDVVMALANDMTKVLN